MMKLWSILICTLALAWAGCNFHSSNDIIRQATRAAGQKDWKTVRLLTEKRVHAVPTDSDASTLLALALFYTEPDNPESIFRAINYMRQVTTSNKDRYDFFLIYGWILLNTGHIQEAQHPLSMAYDLHLKSPHAIGQEAQGMVRYARGRCCMMNGLYKEALKYYEQAAKSNGYNDWTTLYNDMAFCNFYLRQYGDAMRNMTLANQKNNLGKQKAEQELLRNPEAPHYDNPYEYIYVLNTAVLVDYLSFPQYNPQNSAAFAPFRSSWYASAEGMVAAATRGVDNASQQQALVNLQTKLHQRLLAVTPKQ